MVIPEIFRTSVVSASFSVCELTMMCLCYIPRVKKFRFASSVCIKFDLLVDLYNEDVSSILEATKITVFAIFFLGNFDYRNFVCLLFLSAYFPSHDIFIWLKKFLRGCMKTSWRRQVAKELEMLLKPYRCPKKKWEETWMEICQETAENRQQWRAVVRDLTMADKRQQCLQTP